MRSNLWINIDTYNKLVIAGDSIGDVQCTDEQDNNNNTVEYYKTKDELLESMITVASEHKRRALERHFKTPCVTIKVEKGEDKRRELERYFKKPYNTIDPEIYKDLRFIHTIETGKYKHHTKHYFYDGNYGSRYLPLEEVQQD